MALVSKTRTEDKAFYVDLLDTISVIANSRVAHTDQAKETIKSLYESAEQLKHKIETHDYTKDDEMRERFDALFAKIESK